jgi:hypothetical protein
MELDQFLEIIRNIKYRKPFRPHRYLALLTIIDIIENQIEKKEKAQNEFYYDNEFKQLFKYNYKNYHGPNDTNNSFIPFFHFKNAGGNIGEFWFPIPIPGMEPDFKRLITVHSGRELNEIIKYAKLDENIFKELKLNPKSREKVRNEIKQCLEVGLKQSGNNDKD